ncbi:MAG: U32 family peptidase [Reyranella sp.]|nr:U32 family peptidase [Reyranella sp.]
MKPVLTLGPHLYHWPADEWRDFYYRTADEAPVESVCIGEIVCPKRAPFTLPHYEAVIARLCAAGKEVVLSTPVLIVDDRDVALLQGALAMEDFLVEANDVAALALLSGRPHAVGPYVNTYNRATAVRLAAGGAVRVTVPVELPAESVGLLAGLPAPDIEVQVFGRWPLAVSARCYHARAYGRSKDACLYACGEDPDGLPVDTLDGEHFLAVNGVQTLSSSYGCLLRELGRLRQSGVRRFRLSPQRTDMVAIAKLYRGVLDDQLSAEEAWVSMECLANAVSLSNGFFHGHEGVRLV